MSNISHDRIFLRANRRRNSIISEGLKVAIIRFVLFGKSGGAVFCPECFKVLITSNKDRTRRWKNPDGSKKPFTC
jgi:hypothetical protein